MSSMPDSQATTASVAKADDPIVGGPVSAGSRAGGGAGSADPPTRQVALRPARSRVDQIGSAIAVVFLVAGALFDVFSGVGLLATILVVTMYVAMSQGWALVGTYLGYFNFGLAMFFGIGAYADALASSDWHLSVLAALPVALAVGAIAGAVFGAVLLRFRGPIFAVATFILAFAVQSLVSTTSFTQSSLGISIVPPDLGPRTSDQVFIALNGALIVVVAIGTWILDRSRAWRVMTAIRDDETGASAVGINTVMVKILAFTASGAVVAVAGGLYAARSFYIDPVTTFDFTLTLYAVIGALAVGRSRWWSGVIGGALVGAANQLLLTYVGGVTNEIVFGIAIVAIGRFLVAGDRPALRLRRAPRSASTEGPARTPR